MTDNINEKDLQLIPDEAAAEAAAETAADTSSFLAEAKTVLDEELEARQEEAEPEAEASEPEKAEDAAPEEAGSAEPEPAVIAGEPSFLAEAKAAIEGEQESAFFTDIKAVLEKDSKPNSPMETFEDTELEGIELEGQANGSEEDDDTAVPEGAGGEGPDAKPAKGTRKRRKKEPDPETSEEAETEPAPVETLPARPRMSEAERRRLNAARRRQRVRRLLAEAPLDEHGDPINSGDSPNSIFDEDYAEISRQYTRREIVEGVIESIRQRPGGIGWVETNYKNYRVLIPFSELDLQISGLEQLSREEQARRQYAEISAMMGATIHYMITDIDRENHLVAGSCAAANRIRREKGLNRKDIDGNYMVYNGRQVTGTILSVFEKFAYVDVYGYRARLRNSDISSDYTEDANEVLYPGQVVKLFVVEIERDQDGNVKRLFVSMRDDKREREKKEQIAQTIKRGEQYMGRVISLSRDVIFVRLNIGLTAMVYISNGVQGRRIPGMNEKVSVKVLSVEKNRKNGNPIIHGRILRSINFNAR